VVTKVVLASGTFDLLHFGHVRFLEESKRAAGEGARLVVVVARDSTVMERKGEKPVMSEDQRRALVDALEVVDEAVLGFENFSIEGVIERIKPDVVAVGHDQEGIEREVRKAVKDKSLDVKVMRIGRFGKKELNSSSKIKERIAEAYGRE
jgi:FAD synthetase